MKFLFRPNFSELEPSAILEAVGQAFFSLSLGMGAMLTYGSYMRRDSSIPRSVVEICLLDSLMGILACVIMFSIINTSDIEVAKSAAPTVKRVTQELGGKSANILLQDADLEEAVTHGVQKCFGNSGLTSSLEHFTHFFDVNTFSFGNVLEGFASFSASFFLPSSESSFA